MLELAKFMSVADNFQIIGRSFNGGSKAKQHCEKKNNEFHSFKC